VTSIESTAGEINKFLQNSEISTGRGIVPIGLGVYREMKNREPSVFRRNREQKTELLILGTIEPRKGILDFLELVDQSHDFHLKYQINIVGKMGWLSRNERIRFNRILRRHSNITWFESPNDSHLEEIFEHSNVLLFPSKGEGFGLPVIEALLKGLKVIARDIPSIREIRDTLVGAPIALVDFKSISELENKLDYFASVESSGDYSYSETSDLIHGNFNFMNVAHALANLVQLEIDK
jgi:glycosyltransferase involved in cell wall biosynthesis